MIEINCYGGRIGRFCWENSDRGGLFQLSGESYTIFHPGCCGWDETWPERRSWPAMPWSKGNAADDHWRDFAAFELWLDRQLGTEKLYYIDLNILDKNMLYSMFCAVFQCGIDAGQDPWGWAQRVEQQTTITTEAT